MLKKLSELEYKLDKSSTLTVILGDNQILKASPLEILVIADEIVRAQTQDTKLDAAESVYLQVLKTLDIPEDLIQNIRTKLRMPYAVTQQEPESTNTEIKDEHKMLYEFVAAFVNSNSRENEFEIEEFSVFGIDIKSLPNILEEYGFATEPNGNSIIIKFKNESP